MPILLQLQKLLWKGDGGWKKSVFASSFFADQKIVSWVRTWYIALFSHTCSYCHRHIYVNMHSDFGDFNAGDCHVMEITSILQLKVIQTWVS